MPKLYNRKEIVNMLGVSKTTIYNHIRKLNICHIKTVKYNRLYNEKQIIDINDSIKKTETIKYYPLKTIETWEIFHSIMNVK